MSSILSLIISLSQYGLMKFSDTNICVYLYFCIKEKLLTHSKGMACVVVLVSGALYLKCKPILLQFSVN